MYVIYESREDSESWILITRTIFFLFLLMLYLYEVMDGHQTYYRDHFVMFVSQIMMLYTLNVFSADVYYISVLLLLFSH